MLKRFMLGALLLLSGCQKTETIHVSVASSLQEVTEQLIDVYTEQENVNIRLNTGGSNTLYQQITQGFDVDLYISADPFYVEQLNTEGLVVEHAEFAKNKVVLASNREDLTEISQLSASDVSIILASEHVPIAMYAHQILKQYDEQMPGFYESVMNNVVSYESNVRQVLLKLSLNVADVGFLYETDLALESAQHLTKIALKDAESAHATYELAVLSDEEVAIDFYEFLKSDEAKEILKNDGYSH